MARDEVLLWGMGYSGDKSGGEQGGRESDEGPGESIVTQILFMKAVYLRFCLVIMRIGSVSQRATIISLLAALITWL